MCLMRSSWPNKPNWSNIQHPHVLRYHIQIPWRLQMSVSSGPSAAAVMQQLARFNWGLNWSCQMGENEKADHVGRLQPLSMLRERCCQKFMTQCYKTGIILSLKMQFPRKMTFYIENDKLWVTHEWYMAAPIAALKYEPTVHPYWFFRCCKLTYVRK